MPEGTQIDPKDPRVINLVGRGLDKMALRVNLASGTWELVDKTGAVQAGGGGATNYDQLQDGTNAHPFTTANQSKLAAITGTNTGDQALALSGSVLSISGGNSVTLPSGGSTTPEDARKFFVTPTGGNDTAAIQSAINSAAASSAGSVRVLLTEGTYRLDAQVLCRDPRVQFHGMGARTLINLNFAAGDAILYAPSSTPTSLTDPTQGMADVWMANFRVNSLVNRTSGAAIRAEYTYRALFENILIGERVDPGGTLNHYDGIVLPYQGNATIRKSGIYTHHDGVMYSGTTTQSGIYTYNGLMTDVQVYGNNAAGSTGVHATGGSGGFTVGVGCDVAQYDTGLSYDKSFINVTNREGFVRNATFDSNNSRGINVADDSLAIFDCTGTWIAGNGRTGTGTKYAAYIGHACKATMTGGRIYANDGAAAVLAMGELLASGVLCTAHTNGDVFQVGSGGIATVNGCDVRDNTGTDGNPSAGVRALSGATLAAISGGNFYNQRIAVTGAAIYRVSGVCGHSDAGNAPGNTGPFGNE